MVWNIDKTIEFCYGHRVWSQKLNGEFAKDLQCACRHLHGHEGKVQVYLTADVLVDGMVTDFRHLEWLKKFIDTFIDHQFIIDRNDPAFYHIVQTSPETALAMEEIRVPGTDYVVAERIRSRASNNNPAKEALDEITEGITIVNFVPTSENLARWMHEIVNAKMSKIGIECSQIDWWETPKSRSSYRG